jgi:hypothetical protein
MWHMCRWWFDSVTDFDYSLRDNANYYGEGLNYRDINKRATVESAHATECFELTQPEYESKCFDDLLAEEDDDDSNDESMHILVTVLVVSCCVFIAVLLSLLSQAFGWFASSGNSGLAKQEVTSSRNRENSEL